MGRRKPEGADGVVVRRSGVHGRGLFAKRAFKRGARVIEYVGRKIPHAASEKLTNEQWKRGRVYTFELTKKHDIDGSPLWNKARWANHSCAPNCTTDIIKGRIWILALRRILPGDEITYDYNFPVDDELAPCRCGASNCRGYMVGSRYKRALERRLVKLGKARAGI